MTLGHHPTFWCLLTACIVGLKIIILLLGSRGRIMLCNYVYTTTYDK